MKITALVENYSECGLQTRPGLSLYIETQKHKILFDLGPDNALFENAKARNIDLSKVDTVIISHGHMDHGGALKQFWQINSAAKIYVQRKAFEPHYSKLLFLKISVGIDQTLESNSQIVLTEGDYQIDEELTLFTVDRTDKCYSCANDSLYDESGKDTFAHEQNLVITENETALIMGCGHAGVVNIMEKAQKWQPQICVGGYHLTNPLTKKPVSAELLASIGEVLRSYSDTRFYTCHCTGREAFRLLAEKAPNLSYLSCGESIEA